MLRASCKCRLSLYEDEQIAPVLDQIRHCHIYMIGLTPKVVLIGAAQNGRDLVTSFEAASKRYDLHWPMPAATALKGDDETGWWVEDAAGAKSFPSLAYAVKRLSDEQDAIGFDVLYIGQAFGGDGSRNALDRLKKHETLQKISVKGIPEGYVLTILMLAIEPSNQLITMINPWAKDQSHGLERMKKGLLFDTNEAERTTLYEAALIRYFQPSFNKEFKNSFPSTNMKVLAECYDKDFSALVAEICIDELPFKLFSAAAQRTGTGYHYAKHNLHNDESRRVFFTEVTA